MAKPRWEVGSVFAVPMIDGSYAIGQVIGHEPEAMNSVTCAFFHCRLVELPPSLGAPPLRKLISAQFTTKDLLNKRVWKVLGTAPVEVPREHFPYEETRKSGWVGAKIIGSGIIVDFLQAFFGLSNWDQMLDPQYFDRLLISPSVKPNELKYEKAKGRSPEAC